MSGIYKSYDIRGVYPSEINKKVFYQLGLHIKKLRIKKLAVGRDARLSSDALFKAFTRGLINEGIDILDLGVVTSPMLSFFCITNKHMGAMITASHDPKEYNGIKFIDKNAIQLGYGFLLNRLENLMLTPVAKTKKKGRIKKVSILKHYLDYLKRKFEGKFARPLKVVYDCSNGVGGVPLDILDKLPMKVKIIDRRADGNFPNHACDQTRPENFRALQDEVLKQKADIGVIFDGDADRCAFVDELGGIVPMDISFLVLALHELERTKIDKPKILFDLRYSKVVAEVLRKKKALPVIMRVGNPFYKKIIHKDKKVLLAGEFSGHIMYKEHSGIDDPLFASLKMISFLSNSKDALSKIISAYKKYYSSGEFSIYAENPDKILKAFAHHYRNFKLTMLDGLSVDRGDVWFNVRASKTEPLIRFVIEGKSPGIIESQKEELMQVVEDYDRE